MRLSRGFQKKDKAHPHSGNTQCTPRQPAGTIAPAPFFDISRSDSQLLGRLPGTHIMCCSPPRAVSLFTHRMIIYLMTYFANRAGEGQRKKGREMQKASQLHSTPAHLDTFPSDGLGEKLQDSVYPENTASCICLLCANTLHLCEYSWAKLGAVVLIGLASCCKWVESRRDD